MDWLENVIGLQHIGVPTNNIDLTIEFFQKVGFEIVYQTINEEVNEKVAFLKLKNIMIEVYENGQALGKAGAINHIAIDVADIEKAFERAKVKKFKLLNEEIQFLQFWENGVKYFTIKGPNAECVEFSQYL